MNASKTYCFLCRNSLNDRNFKCRIRNFPPFFQPNPRKLLSGAVSSLTDNDGTIDPKNFATIRTTSIVQRQQKEHLQVSKKEKKSRQMATSSKILLYSASFSKNTGCLVSYCSFWEAKIKIFFNDFRCWSKVLNNRTFKISANLAFKSQIADDLFFMH